MAWNMASMVFSQILNAGLFIFVASKLDPKIFGIFGLAAVFIDFLYMQWSTACIDAITQKQDYSRRTLSSNFWACMMVMVAGVAAAVLSAPMIAAWQNEPSLTPVLIALSLTLLPLPFENAPYAVMRQKMDFKSIAVRRMGASLTGGVAAAIMVLTPFAAWALVVQRFVQVLVSISVMMAHSRIFPTFEFHFPTAVSFLSTTTRIFTAQGILGLISRAADLVVASFFGLVILGCLRIASKLLEVLIAALVNPIQQMWVVLISQTERASTERRNIYLHLSSLTALLCLPGFVGVALTSKELTGLILPPDYAPMASMLAVLCCIQVFVPIIWFRTALFTAFNRLNQLNAFAAVETVIVLAAFFLVRPLGVEAVLAAMALQSVTSIILSLHIILREMGVKLSEFVNALLPAYVSCGLMVIAVLAFGYIFPNLPDLHLLVAKAALGGAIYIGSLLILFRSSTINVIQSLRQRSA
jgi:O-antigen/teichoic acid export membrane protein